MSWVGGQKYRGRACPNDFAIKAFDNEKGTRYVEGLIEVTMGPQQGQRIRYRGYVNSDKNREATAAELRTMGCKLQRWGDFSGIGKEEIGFTCMTDDDGKGGVFYRAAFVKPVPKIDRKNAIAAADLEDMPLPPPPKDARANGAEGSRGDAYDGDDAEPASDFP